MVHVNTDDLTRVVGGRARSLTVLCDFDGVVADLHSEWARRYNQAYMDSLTCAELFNGWESWKEKVKCSADEFYGFLQEDDLYENVEPIFHAKEAIQQLRRQGHRVVFVTSCVDGSVDQKVEWLRRHTLLDKGRAPGRNFVAINDKSLVQGDIMIDDAPHNLENTSAFPILFDSYHNQDEMRFFRARGWHHVLIEIEEFAVRGAPGYPLRPPPEDRYPGGMSEQRFPAPPSRAAWPLDEETVEAADRFVRGIKGQHRYPTPASGEVRTVSSTGGEKGKKMARYDLLPVSPLREVAEHYGRGAEKYEDRNWERGYDWSLSYAALQRHAQAFWGGEELDEETGSHHLAAVVFHALALMEFCDTRPEFDDRPGQERTDLARSGTDG